MTGSNHDAVLRPAAVATHRRLRVLLVAPSMDTIGGQSVQADLILRHSRSEPFLEMLFQPINPRLPAVLRKVHRMKYVRTLPTFSLYCAQLFRAVQQCDVVHVFSASYFSFVLAATPAIYFARFLRKPVILNYHSGEAEDHLARWPSAVRTLRLAERLVVPTGYLVRVFERYGLQAQAIPNVVDLSAFKFRLRTNPKPAFLVNRNFEAHYNVALVIRAFARIQGRLPEARLTVAGDGPSREALCQLASSLSLRNTQFVGQVQPHEMAKLYDEHDIWLNGSDVDNMPLSILEAYACGLAVVSTNPGGIPYIVDDSRTGRLVERGDEVALADKALRLLETPELFAQLTQAGFAECAKYTWESVGSRWMAQYSALAH